MTGLLDTRDLLDEAVRQVEGLHLAAKGLSDRNESAAMQRLILDLARRLEGVVDDLEKIDAEGRASS